MNKYGQAAIMAVKLINTKRADSPRTAWEMATTELLGNGTSSQSKVCPRNTFLALCETGKVKGVEPGAYTRSKRNKEYALEALELLADNPSLSNDPNKLWSIIQNGVKKSYNSQMDVVVALWINKLIFD